MCLCPRVYLLSVRGPSRPKRVVGDLGIVGTLSRSIAMSWLPALPPDESPGWLPDSTVEMRVLSRVKRKVRTAKPVKKTKEVKTQNKKNTVEIVAGLPLLPLPDGVLSTGSSSKLEGWEEVKKVKKGKLVKEPKKGKEVKNKRTVTGSGMELAAATGAGEAATGASKVKKGKIAHSGPYVDLPWRREAKSDLSEVARFFGADLGSLEAMPMGIEEAKLVFQEQGVPVGQLMTGDGPCVRECLTNEIGTTPVVFWEIFAGSCNLTKAVVKECQNRSATGDQQAAVLPPVEIDEKKLSSTRWKGLHTWDVLLPSQRRLVWAYLALLQPRWVHLGPPCTFWSPLARRCNLRSEADNEQLRLKALAFLVFPLQVCNFQRQRQRCWSLEQPPHCVSWNLDIVKEFTDRELASGNAALKFDSCAWGHKDPGNGKPFLKRQCFVSNAQLIRLHRRCSCSPRAHQVVEGTVKSGSRKGELRSTISGEYPVDFCNAFAGIIGEHSWPLATQHAGF